MTNSNNTAIPSSPEPTTKATIQAQGISTAEATTTTTSNQDKPVAAVSDMSTTPSNTTDEVSNTVAVSNNDSSAVSSTTNAAIDTDTQKPTTTEDATTDVKVEVQDAAASQPTETTNPDAPVVATPDTLKPTNSNASSPAATSAMSAQDISIEENTKDPAKYQNAEDIIRIEHLYNSFGTHVIHEDLNMTVKKGELIALVGGSGSGKTTLLRSIIMLQKPVKGQIYLMDKPVWGSSFQAEQSLRKQFGMLFQSGALFSSLTVLENIMVPLQVHTKLNKKDMEEVAMLKLTLAGLQPQAANLLPKDISGGMIKRAGLARALALDPQLLFLDEPTAGLDPVSASEFDQLMKQLKESLNLTVVMVTHDLDSIWAISDRVAFLGNKTLLACEPIQDLVNDTNPLIQHYFQGPRGRAAGEAYGTQI